MEKLQGRGENFDWSFICSRDGGGSGREGGDALEQRKENELPSSESKRSKRKRKSSTWLQEQYVSDFDNLKVSVRFFTLSIKVSFFSLTNKSADSFLCFNMMMNRRMRTSVVALVSMWASGGILIIASTTPLFSLTMILMVNVRCCMMTME